LFAVPAPAQRVLGEREILGTVRTHMHKAPLTALSAGLAARLRADGIDASVEIVDMQTGGDDRVKYGELRLGNLTLEKLRVGMPFDAVESVVAGSDVVGVNSNFTHSRRIVVDFIAFAKRVNPRSFVVVGGTEATCAPEPYLRAGADAVVLGEGELSFSALLARVARNERPDGVPNVMFVRDGEIVRTARSFLSSSGAFDVDDLEPPNLDLIDLETCSDTGEGEPPFHLPGPFLSVETSRGCAQACSFCATPVAKGRYRFMRPASVARHLDHFRRHGVRALLFQEDNILSRLHRRRDGSPSFPDGRADLLAILRLAREKGFCWEFTNGIEFGQLERSGRLDQEVLDAMLWHEQTGERFDGCYRVTVPLENLTDRASSLFRKLKPIGSAAKVIRAMAATGVPALTFNLIIGRPEDSEDDLLLSYERCLAIRELCRAENDRTQVYFNVYVLSLLPGTIDFERHHDLLAFDLDVDPEVVTFYLGSLNTPHFTPLEITRARGTMTKLLNGDAAIHSYDETAYLTSPRFEALFSRAAPSALV